MKKAILFIPVLLCFSIRAQETPKRFELGSTLLTANSLGYYYFNERSRFEFLNMLFFRYKLCNRLSLRAAAGYSEYNFSTQTPPYFIDGGGASSFNKDFRIGGGAQFSFFKTSEFLYVFMDANYRNVFSKGYSYSDWAGSDISFAKTINGCDGYLGLGGKIPICKSVYLSPEIFCRMSYEHQKGAASDLAGQVYPITGFRRYGSAGARLNLTVKF